MKRLLLASIAICCFLFTVQSATAKGCLEGAALGAAVGHMRHHTFLGIFGGCAGGLYVHHLYAKWHREHPNGNLNQFADDYHGWLPAGWDERLRTAGDASPHPGTTKPTGYKSTGNQQVLRNTIAPETADTLVVVDRRTDERLPLAAESSAATDAPLVRFRS
jgi:hypothetical protein